MKICKQNKQTKYSDDVLLNAVIKFGLPLLDTWIQDLLLDMPSDIDSKAEDVFDFTLFLETTWFHSKAQKHTSTEQTN